MQDKDEMLRQQILDILQACTYDFDYGYGVTGPLNVRMVDRNKASYQLLELLGKMQEDISKLADSLKSIVGIAENASGLLPAEELDILTAKKLLHKYDYLSKPTP